MLRSIKRKSCAVKKAKKYARTPYVHLVRTAFGNKIDSVQCGKEVKQLAKDKETAVGLMQSDKITCPDCLGLNKPKEEYQTLQDIVTNQLEVD